MKRMAKPAIVSSILSLFMFFRTPHKLNASRISLVSGNKHMWYLGGTVSMTKVNLGISRTTAKSDL